MSAFKVVVLSVALILTVGEVTYVQAAKFDTPKTSFKSTTSANEERAYTIPLSEMHIPIWDRIKLAYWHCTKQSAGNVLEGLKLNEAALGLFQNPKFFAWIAYVDKVHPDDQYLVTRLLMQKIPERDLTDAITAAMKDEKTEPLARLLTFQRWDIWLNDGHSPLEIFGYLGLTSENFFSKPAFNDWLKYIPAYLFKIKSKESFIDILRLQFDGEPLLPVFEQIYTKSKAAWTTLEKHLISDSLKKYDPASFMEAVGIKSPYSEEVGTNFNDFAYDLWRRYTNKYIKAAKDAGMTPPLQSKVLFDALTKNFPEQVIMAAIVVMKNNPATEKIGFRLQRHLFDKWAAERHLQDEHQMSAFSNRDRE